MAATRLLASSSLSVPALVTDTRGQDCGQGICKNSVPVGRLSCHTLRALGPELS